MLRQDYENKIQKLKCNIIKALIDDKKAYLSEVSLKPYLGFTNEYAVLGTNKQDIKIAVRELNELKKYAPIYAKENSYNVLFVSF